MGRRRYESPRKQLDYLAGCDPMMGVFLKEHEVDEIYNIDDKCAIFSVLNLGENEVLKYAVKTRGKDEFEKLGPSLERVVLRGLRAQFAVQEIEGIQVLKRPIFYEGITGLMGPFEYLPGLNLGSDLYDSEPRVVLEKFKELDLTLSEVHKKGVIHGDIKPENIIDNGRLYLIDWSAAKFVNEPREEGEPLLLTLEYMYPGNDRCPDNWALSLCLLKSLKMGTKLNLREVRDAPNDIVRRNENRLNERYGREYRDFYLELANRTPQTEFSGSLGNLWERLILSENYGPSQPAEKTFSFSEYF